MIFTLALLSTISYDVTLGFSPVSPITRQCASFSSSTTQFAEPDDSDKGDADWRAFRAKLVMAESGMTSDTSEATESAIDDEEDVDGFGALFSQQTTNEQSTGTKFQLPEGFTPLDPTQWAYDAGAIIEKGAVILGGAEQDFGFGLRQQYFHKAVILVLDHDEETFTKGIILNRPSEKIMKDDDGGEWRVWFGGDVQGLDSILPDIVCLHSLKGEEAREVSETVMKDIQVRYASTIMHIL